MLGKYSTRERLLLRLMMRAIDHAELAHEINNACASVAANLKYVGLQSKTLCDPKHIKNEPTREIFEEFAEISEESLRAIQRVTQALSQPKTAANNDIVEIEAGKLVNRIVGCVNDYLPGYDLNAVVTQAKVFATYRVLVSSLLEILLACIDARRTSDSPEKKRVDIILQTETSEECTISVSPHLNSSQCAIVRTAIERQAELLLNTNFHIKLVESTDEPVIQFCLLTKRH